MFVFSGEFVGKNVGYNGRHHNSESCQAPKRRTGFLASNASPHLAVSRVVKGGVAQETGFIEIGDVILEVNGKSLENVPYLKALEILDRVPTGETAVLKIRARDGFQAYLETVLDNEGVVKTVRVTKSKTSANGPSGMDKKSNGEKQEVKKGDSPSEKSGIPKCPITNATSNYQPPKFVKLQNVMDKTVTTDTLHQKALQVS